MHLRGVVIAAAALLAVAVIVLAVGTDEPSIPAEMEALASHAGAATVAPQKQQLAQGYANWLRWSAGLHGGKTSLSHEFEENMGPEKPDYGRMSEAGKVLAKLRKTIGREKRVLKRLEHMMKDRKKGKQPESVVVHVGSVGPRGPRGDRGRRGKRGPIGPRGYAGPKGKLGDIGSTGPRGADGDRGKTGPKGEPGRRGITGRRGARGETGESGPQGKQGPRGFVGPAGPPGLQARNGEEGAQGMAGPAGATGLPGPIGPRGFPGKFILPPPPVVTYALSGMVRNAVDGNPIIPVVTVLAVQDGKTIATAQSNQGNYRFAGLASGKYDIKATVGGYCESVDTLTILTQAATFNINMSPTLTGNQLRIVLTWGAQPTDLDSHLRSPDQCLTFYNNKNGCPGVSLDRDITNGWGPETITISAPKAGSYRYRVHNYSRTSANLISNGLTNQPATVNVYRGCDRTTYVCGKDGDVDATSKFWEVFSYDGGTGVVTKAAS